MTTTQSDNSNDTASTSSSNTHKIHSDWIDSGNINNTTATKGTARQQTSPSSCVEGVVRLPYVPQIPKPSADPTLST